MRAVVFGQSGIQKDSYLTEVLDVTHSAGKDFQIINLGTRMHDLDTGKRRPEIYPSLPVFERELLRQQALKAVIREIEETPDRDYVLNAHAVFKLDTGLVPAADTDLIKEFAPEIIVVLIDDFHYIHRRLQGTAFEKLSYSDILEWRGAEITAAKTLAQEVFEQGVGSESSGVWRFYVLARGHHPHVLYRLLYERNQRRRIYSSFAITGATPEQRKKISDFKSRLSQKHIVFDPFKIVERGMFALADSLLEDMADKCRDVKEIDAAYLTLIRELQNAGVENPNVNTRAEFAPLEVLPGLMDLRYSPPQFDRSQREDNDSVMLFDPSYDFAFDELQSLKATVDGQILSRDYLLIDQSEVVCALVPWNTDLKKAEISAGSQSELTYAKLIGRERLVVCEGKKHKVSPWVIEHASEFFTTLEALESKLEKEK